MRARIVGLIFVTCAAVFAGTAGAAHADNAKGNKAPTEALTPQQVHAIATKRAAERLFLNGLIRPRGPSRGVVSSGVVNPDYCALVRGVRPHCGGGSMPASAYLPGNQTPQITSYYCGPATVHEMLNSLGVGMSQDTAASRMGTDSNGTAWSGGPTSPSGHPVQDVVNNHESINDYVSIPVAYPVTSSALADFKTDLQVDVYGVGAPIAGDAEEVAGGPHLMGHPDSNIFHWFDIRGYQNSGASTMYEDSVHGATSISWSGGVPAYSTMSSSTVATIISGRGYIW